MTDPKDYGGIAVILTLSQMYRKVQGNLMKKLYHRQTSRRASRIWTGRCTIDNIFTLKIATKKRVQRNRETHIALVDLKEAYASVSIL